MAEDKVLDNNKDDVVDANVSPTDVIDVGEDILKHHLYVIHIKGKNNALSDEDPHICIGWSCLDDMTGITTKDEIKKIYYDYYKDNGSSRAFGQIWRFVGEMQVGDYVIYSKPNIIHIGRVTSDLYRKSPKADEQHYDYVNNRRVEWVKKNIDRSSLSEGLNISLSVPLTFYAADKYANEIARLLNGISVSKKVEKIVVEVDRGDVTLEKLNYKRNRIVFGAPGTGKSYKLENDKKIVEESATRIERVTFHPDYTYANFVGTYKPVSKTVVEDGKENEIITYEFVAGPFLRVYVAAIKAVRENETNPKPALLLIEEINRANMAAVFGDIFQLLDRNKDGKSEYSITTSEDIKKYLVKELGGKTTDYEEMSLPSNMYIWATMNSADQGVFPMDTAFKRRWNFEYVGIDENEESIEDYKIQGTDFKALNWNCLRKAINEVLINNCRVNEDKLMGPYFLSKEILEQPNNIDDFCNKVIMYLFDDAGKTHRKELFNELIYSRICTQFKDKGIGAFKSVVKDEYNKLFKPADENDDSKNVIENDNSANGDDN